jgi:hypothetical protein
MNPRALRFGASVPKTFHFKLLTITATVLLAVAAVVVSVHSSSPPVSRAEGTAASGENPRATRGESKTSSTAAVRRLAGLAAPLAPPAPTVTATKTDALFTDVDGDLQADPGDTLKYTVTINSTGDATGVTFTDTVDPNTAFVPGSLTATPVAVDDSYSALGNVRISVPAPGVLGNDFTGVPSGTASAAATSTNGGNVAMNADGSFTYNPPAGYEGTDTFNYTLTNTAGSNSGTVTITVSGMIWFVNNNPGACVSSCDGRLTNPFTSLASFQAVNNGTGNNPAANDNIFVYESLIDYVGPVTLLNGQRLLGQDSTASLSAMTGLTPPTYSDPLPTTDSGNAIIVNITSAGNSINVASGNTLRGFTGGNSASDINGTGFGTLTISDVTLNGTGQALDLTTGTLAATFGSISSTNSATTGVSLTGVAGSLTTPTTTITNPAGIGISVGTSSATLDFGNTTSTSSGGVGVSLLTNTGAITFGALNISPDANQRGLLATDNTNTITATSGTISTSASSGATNAAGVEITRASGTTPLLVVLTSVSTTNGTNGIILRNTSGSFSIIGDNANTSQGGNASGGTISNMSGADGTTADDGASNGIGIGIYLNNATNVSLRRMTVNTSSNFGLEAENTNGVTVQYCRFNGTHGDNTSQAEGAARFLQITGTVTIDNCEMTGAKANDVRLDNNSGTLTDFVVSNSSLHDNDNMVGNDGISIDLEGTATIKTHITGSALSNHLGDHIDVSTTGTASADVVITGNTFTGTRPAAPASPGDLGRGIRIFSSAFNSPALIRYNVSSNTMSGTVQGGAIHVTAGQGTGTYTGQITNNIIGTTGVNGSGASQSDGIIIEQTGNGALTTSITGNNIRQYFAQGINVQATLPGTSGTLDATVTGNTLTERATGGTSPGVLLNAGTGSGPPASANQVCFDLNSNDITAAGAEGGAGQEDFRVRQRFSTTVRLPGYGGASNNTAAVIAFLQGQNTGVETGSATVQAPGGGFVGGAACNAPVVPTLPSQTHELAVSQPPSDDDSQSLWAPFGEGHDGDKVGRLSHSDLMWMVQAALERWRTSGISAEDMARLQAATFAIADLPEGQIASASGSGITIDETAAGYGWFIDQSPMEDSEFDVSVPGNELQTTEYSPAFGRTDLLTVVMRQLGQVYKQGKKSGIKGQGSLMQNTLSPAVRRVPDSRTIQLPSSPVGVSGKNLRGNKRTGSQISKASALRPGTSVSRSDVSRNAASNPRTNKANDRGSRLMNHAFRNRTTVPTLSSMLADVMLNIGTLPAGESVTITFNVTVNDPFTGALPQVSNQGTVSGSNFGDVLTDDPTVVGAVDPTVTPIDLPNVSVAVSPGSVAEDGATNLVYTFTRNGSTANAMTVNFSIGGSANFGTSPNDYTQTGAATFTPPTGTVSFSPGSATATVTVNPETDTTVETDETVVLTVTSGIGYVVGSPSSASGTITNDDTDVSVAVSPASVAEDGATNLVYTFTRAGVTTNSLTVNFNIALGGTNAVFPVDYAQSGAATFAPPVGTVTFGAGNSTATVTVDPTTDSLVEPDETVIFTVASGAGYNVGSPASATGTITNDDADVSVTVAPSSASEDGATNLVYTFTRTGFTALPVTVNFSVGGTAVFSSGDYTQTGAATYSDTSGTVVFGPGDSTATVTVDPSADLTVEPDETVILTITSGVGYNVGSPDSATGTIINDDTDVSVAVSPGSVAEDGATNLVYTFSRNGVISSSLTVNFSVGGSAVFSQPDYTQTGAATYSDTSGTVVFGAGNSTATVTIDPSADNTVEPDETVILTVTSGAGYNVGSPSFASGTITNDDTDVSVAVAPASVAEDGATNLVYTFTRNGVTSGALTVNFSVSGSAVFSQPDYTQTGAATYSDTSGTVVFGAGNSTATVTIDPSVDTTIETDETVILTLTSGAGYNVSSPSSATGTISNDDADVSVAVSPASVAEDGATNLVYTFTRTGFTGGALTVNFSVGGTATFGVSPDDYTQTGATTYTTTTGSVTFTPGSPTATVTVNPETDTTAESDETVIITLTAGASYNVVSPNSATGTILNDDTLVSVAVSPSSTAEGGANLVYTFTRTGPTTSAVTANFSVGGSASFPADYSQSGATTFTPPTATVTFGVGSSTATLTVTPLTDCTVEGNETVVFTVQPGSGYGVGSPSTATGTITNTPDSAAPTITLIPNVNMTLWPPNHQYESVAVTDFVASASDNCDPTVNLNSVYILKITSDEAENGNGDGNTLNDIVIGATCKTAQLRAERDGSADGRVYSITFKVKDSAGNFATATAKVTVRKNPNSPAVDSGTAYTVNSSCP